jgi:hypothetical protein
MYSSSSKSPLKENDIIKAFKFNIKLELILENGMKFLMNIILYIWYNLIGGVKMDEQLLLAISNLLDKKLEPIYGRLDKMESRLDKMESRLDKLEKGQEELRKGQEELKNLILEVDAKNVKYHMEMKNDIKELRADVLKLELVTGKNCLDISYLKIAK